MGNDSKTNLMITSLLFVIHLSPAQKCIIQRNSRLTAFSLPPTYSNVFVNRKIKNICIYSKIDINI